MARAGVIREVGAEARCPAVRVVVPSASNAQADREACARLGADARLHRPAPIEAFGQVLGPLALTW